jgi:hypothetical protein
MTKHRSLRAALKNRVTNETEYRVPLVPIAEARRVWEELSQARQTAQAGEFLRAKERGEGGAPSADIERAISAAEASAEQLQKRFDDMFYIVRFRAMPSDDFDALVQLHQPTDGEVQEATEQRVDKPLWNDLTFYPELLERCAVNSELSAEEWAEELKGWTRAERKEVQARALEANIRSYSTALGFG